MLFHQLLKMLTIIIDLQIKLQQLSQEEEVVKMKIPILSQVITIQQL